LKEFWRPRQFKDLPIRDAEAEMDRARKAEHTGEGREREGINGNQAKKCNRNQSARKS